VKDFIPLGPAGSVPNVLIVAPSSGYNTVQEFVAAAKADPGSFNFASVGIGSAVHLSAERFRASAGYEAVHIPFKGGAEALTEVIAGRVTYYFCPIATALPHIRAGRLRALAVSSPTRAAALPDVPTTLEAGYPDSDYTVWIGFFAPAKSSPAIIATLEREIRKAVDSPVVREKFIQIGVEPMPLTATQFGNQVSREVSTYAAFAKAIGMKMN
jgi:tripartite-type tricarboxylate transporter receptor subunit TctC